MDIWIFRNWLETCDIWIKYIVWACSVACFSNGTCISFIGCVFWYDYLAHPWCGSLSPCLLLILYGLYLGSWWVLEVKSWDCWVLTDSGVMTEVVPAQRRKDVASGLMNQHSAWVGRGKYRLPGLSDVWSLTWEATRNFKQILKIWKFSFRESGELKSKKERGNRSWPLTWWTQRHFMVHEMGMLGFQR